MALQWPTTPDTPSRYDPGISGITGAFMKTSELTLPEIALIAGTRGMLGAGLALLLGGRLDPARRQKIGWTFLTIGVVTTLPLFLDVLSKRQPEAEDEEEFRA